MLAWGRFMIQLFQFPFFEHQHSQARMRFGIEDRLSHHCQDPKLWLLRAPATAPHHNIVVLTVRTLAPLLLYDTDTITDGELCYLYEEAMSNAR
jgi:hypothetical protein